MPQGLQNVWHFLYVFPTTWFFSDLRLSQRCYIREEKIGEDKKDKEDEKKQEDSFFKGFEKWLGKKVEIWGNDFDAVEWRQYVVTLFLLWLDIEPSLIPAFLPKLNA